MKQKLKHAKLPLKTFIEVYLNAIVTGKRI